jgi:peptidoglycan/LPS O-acetylase OafA/YrhL
VPRQFLKNGVSRSMNEAPQISLLEVSDDRPASEQRPRRRDLAGLDGLRALAVALVILHHSAEQFSQGGVVRLVADNGGFGVAIFFVLSGFLITYLLLREESDFGRVDLPRFYARRMIRIVPPAYAFIVGLVILAGFGWIVLSPLVLTSCLLFFRNYVTGPAISGHLWSLAVEEHFYLIWPAIFVLCRNPKQRVAIAVAAVAFSPLWRHYMGKTYGFSQLNWMRTDFRYGAILMGCLLALLTRLPQAEKRLGSRWLTNPLFATLTLALLIATFAPQFANGPTILFRDSLQFLCVALLINCVVRTPESWLSKSLDWAPIALVGRLSYSLYLWQQIFCLLVWPGHSSPFMRLPLNLIPITFFATLSYLIIERPLFKVRAKFRPG